MDISIKSYNTVIFPGISGLSVHIRSFIFDVLIIFNYTVARKFLTHINLLLRLIVVLVQNYGRNTTLLNVISVVALKYNEDSAKMKLNHAMLPANVRIPVKPKLKKFHIFLCFRIRSKNSLEWLLCELGDGGRVMVIGVFAYWDRACDFLVKMIAVGVRSLSHVLKSFSLNFTLSENQKQQHPKKKSTITFCALIGLFYERNSDDTICTYNI